MRADLHVHTTASDGCLTPEGIIRLAAEAGINIIAITDHDSVDGVAPALEAAKAFSSITVIPGVEINTDVPHGEVHILGYFINHTSPELCSRLYNLRTSRKRRAIAMVSRLKALDMEIEWQRVLELASGGSIGRPHIAQALLEKGYITSFQEAFDKYIGRDGPAYVEREKVTPVEAVRFIIEAKGLPVLAHPANIDGLGQLLPQLIDAGLVGIEVWYSNYLPETIGKLETAAKELKLIPTGGSDYHGFGGDAETPLGGVSIPPWVVDRLFTLAGKTL